MGLHGQGSRGPLRLAWGRACEDPLAPNKGREKLRRSIVEALPLLHGRKSRIAQRWELAFSLAPHRDPLAAELALQCFLEGSWKQAGRLAFAPCPQGPGGLSKGAGGSFMHQPYRGTPLAQPDASSVGKSLSASISSISCRRGSHLPIPQQVPRAVWRVR
jgi:hypothetical protein